MKSLLEKDNLPDPLKAFLSLLFGFGVGLGVAFTVADEILNHHNWANYPFIRYVALIMILAMFISLVYLVLTWRDKFESLTLLHTIGFCLALLLYISFTSYDVGSSGLAIVNSQANYTSDDDIRISLDIRNRSGKGAVVDTIVVDFQEIQEGVACDSPVTDRFDFVIDDTIKPLQIKTISKDNLLSSITVTMLDRVSDILANGKIRVQGWINDECPNRQVLIKVPVERYIRSNGSIQVNIYLPRYIRYVETINSLVERGDIIDHILENPMFSVYKGYSLENIGRIIRMNLLWQLSFPGVWIGNRKISIEDQGGGISGSNVVPISRFIYVTLVAENSVTIREVGYLQDQSYK